MPAPWTTTNALGWLTAKVTPAELPVIPHLASGRLPSLTAVLADDKAPEASRFVLRLWSSDLQLSDGSSSKVWIGSVVEEHFDRPISLIAIAQTRPDANAPRDLLSGSSRREWIVARPGPTEDANWDGRVLLLDQNSQ